MSRAGLRRELLDTGLLAEAGATGVYHRSFEFERLVQAVSGAISSAGRGTAQQRWHLGPLEARGTLERSGFTSSFPSLGGVVASAGGDETAAGVDPDTASWLERLEPTDVALCPAGCHPLYPMFAGTSLPAGGVTVEAQTWCYRREPSDDPSRLQAFRQHEFVHVGTMDAAAAHRDRWLERAHDLLLGFGLDVEVVVASDPFTGRVGRLLAASQRSKALKYELVAEIAASEPTAVASANSHEDHFGRAFDVRLDDGTPAHSACIGFGLERVVLALLARHGPDAASWSTDVTARLPGLMTAPQSAAS